MRHPLADHPHFEPWTDPTSGITSYVLHERVAPVQQTLYFVSPSVSADGRWLWFHCAHPPGRHKSLGVVSLDPAQPVIRHFPQAQFDTAAPLVLPDASVLLGIGRTIYQMDLHGTMDARFTLPDDFIQDRRVDRLASHLTLSADGTLLLLDGQVGNEWFVGTAQLSTGTFRLIKRFPRHFNHAQFSPTDPQAFLIAMDHYRDPSTGIRYHYDHRIWLMNTEGSRFECATPHNVASHLKGISHEWWTRDGLIGYVWYENGAWELDPQTMQHTHVWKQPLCHAHCSADRQLWVADESPYYWSTRPCEVLFFDRSTQRVVPIVSAMPEPVLERGPWHIDPHPQFSPDDALISYTTTVRGSVDVALCPVDELRDRSS